MKKKEYVKPEMRICEITKIQLLAGSETLFIGNDENVPTPSEGSIWGD